MSKENEFFQGSGNIFADLDVADADMELAKAELAYIIRCRIRALGLKQKQAAEMLHTDQAKVSAIMSGKVSGYTYDRLMRYLNNLNCDITISIASPKPEHSGKVLVETL